MKRYIFLIVMAQIAFTVCADRKVADNPLFEDDFNNIGNYTANWEKLSNDAPGLVEYISGDDGDGYIKIASDDRTSQGIKHKLTGLKPGTLYRLSARLKTDSVGEGRGAVLFINPQGNMDQPWNASKFIYGSTGWQEVYMDFVSDPEGNAEIALALGFPWGTYNGGKAQGVAYWDDVTVAPTPAGAMKTVAGKHMRIFFDSEKVSVTEKEMKPWVKQLDKVYECYCRLVGDKPFSGRRIDLLATPGIEPGYWALAGNPILINNNTKIGELPEKFNADGDWSFGVTHEMGHCFNAGHMNKSGQWNWNDELFANFRMSYAVEKLNGKVSQDRIYQGKDIINYYKKAYDRTLGAGIASCEGDALHYTLLRVKEKYGWKIYENAFRRLYALGAKDIDWRAPAYDKFLFFLKHLSDEAGEDVTKTCYTAAELKLIEDGFNSPK